MIKRPSTLDNNQKMRRKRQTEYLIELDKCSQISSDDRLIIRRFIKDDDSEVVALFDRFKRDRNQAQLQVSLRKVVQLVKSEQRKNQTHLNEGARRTSEYSQRVQSLNSQPGSYKNSAKCSPQKEEPKRKTITFDISDLKTKIGNCRNTNEKTKEKDISITINRQESVKRKLFACKDSSSKDKSLLERLNSSSSRQLFNKEEINISKVTVRLKGQTQNLVEKPVIKKDETKIQKNPALGQITNNVSYSSSIRNLLICKLKDQKKCERNTEKLTSRVKVDPIDKSQLFDQTASDKINSSITDSVDKQTIENYQPQSNHQNTVVKTSARLIQQQIHHSVQLPFEPFPMYLKSDWRQNLGQSDTTRPRQIYNDLTESRPSFRQKRQKLQTIVGAEQQGSKFGQFYKRIRGVIDGSNC